MKRRNRRKRWRSRILGLAAFAAALLAVGLIFRVKNVTITGNLQYSAEQIREGLCDGLLAGNTLYLQFKYRDGSVPDTLPFLSELHVKMESPSRILVTVSEKELVGCVDKGSYACFDKEGVVLSISDGYSGIPLITGADVGEPVLYQKLPTGSSAQLRTILSLTQLLTYHGLEAEEIRFDENGDMTVYVKGVEAKLGQDEYLEEKIANLRAILQKTEGQRGVLHLESYTGKEVTSFSVSKETEPETSLLEDTSAAPEDGVAGAGTSGMPEDGAAGDGAAAPEDGSAGDGTGTPEEGAQEPSGPTIAMVFNSSGTLVYNVHVENGVVVDAYGNAVPGCTVNENGCVVDAYMNVFDSVTGELIQ